jgi:hypothetical protein
MTFATRARTGTSSSGSPNERRTQGLVAGYAITWRSGRVQDGLSRQPPDAAPFAGNVGYCLIDDGLVDLERATGYSPRLRERANVAPDAHPTWCSAAASSCAR